MPIKSAKRWLKPRALDFYVLAEVVAPFIGGVVFFTFLILMFQALRLADFLIVHGIPIGITAKLALLMCLSFLPMVLPVAFLIAVLMGFGRLSADSELVAMKSSGVSIHRMCFPIFMFSIIVVIVSLFLNIEWVPWGERSFKSLQIRVSNTKVVSAIKEGTFTSGFFDLLIFADKVDEKENKLYKTFLFDERDPKNPVVVVADEGEIQPVNTFTELGAAIMLKLFKGNIHQNEIASESYSRVDFNQYRLYLTIEEGEDTKAIKPTMLSYHSLKDEIQGLRDQKNTKSSRYKELSTEFWRRYSVALSPLIFVFLGIGFGTQRTRAVGAGAALVSIVACSLYYVVQISAIAWSQKGFLPSGILMQLPNIVAAIAAYRAYRSATW